MNTQALLIRPWKSDAVVLGGAECVWKDLEKASEWISGATLFIATNDAGEHFRERIDHWVTLHPLSFARWANRRARNGGNSDYTVWAHRAERHVDKVIKDWGGSSGLLAVQVALKLGCQRILLCGVPMDPRGHFFKQDEWTACHVYRKAWRRQLEEIRPYVRSMSGWTREMLGPPGDTEEKYGT